MNNYILVPLDLYAELNSNEVNVLAKIYNLKKEFDTLFVSNSRLSNIFNFKISSRSLTRIISKLEQLDYITLELKNTTTNNKRRIIDITEKTKLFFKSNKVIKTLEIKENPLDEIYEEWEN